MPAALLMTSLQARVQVLLEERLEMAALVTRLNSSITTSKLDLPATNLTAWWHQNLTALLRFWGDGAG